MRHILRHKRGTRSEREACMKYVNPTISKLAKPRKGYRGRLKYTDCNGKRREVSKTFSCRTLSEAKVLLAQWHADMNREAEEAEARAESGVLVADLVRDHIDTAERSGVIEPSTVSGYRTSLRYIERMGDVAVGDLDRESIERWEGELTESGLSSSSVGKAHRLLKMVLTRAVDSDLIPKNPMALVKPPKRKPVHPGINALDKATRDRVSELLSSMRPCPLSVAALMSMYTGMRREEVCGLRWQDVDLDRGVLWVRQAIGVGHGRPYVKGSKTDRVRDIAIPATLERVLREWRGYQTPGCSYVIGDPMGFCDPYVITKGWGSLAKQFGIIGSEGRYCTFHDLRHTWATAAVAAGIDIKTVSSNLGHANAAMTLNIYASADPEAKRRAAEVMDGVI